MLLQLWKISSKEKVQTWQETASEAFNGAQNRNILSFYLLFSLRNGEIIMLKTWHVRVCRFIGNLGLHMWYSIVVILFLVIKFLFYKCVLRVLTIEEHLAAQWFAFSYGLGGALCQRKFKAIKQLLKPLWLSHYYPRIRLFIKKKKTYPLNPSHALTISCKMMTTPSQ